jgi:hypothetical protein
MVSPHSMLAHGMDMIGSFAVAVYLAFCGIRTIRESFIESCEVDE